MPCVSTALRLGHCRCLVFPLPLPCFPLPLPCVSTAFAAKTTPFLAVIRSDFARLISDKHHLVSTVTTPGASHSCKHHDRLALQTPSSGLNPADSIVLSTRPPAPGSLLCRALLSTLVMTLVETLVESGIFNSPFPGMQPTAFGEYVDDHLRRTVEGLGKTPAICY